MPRAVQGQLLSLTPLLLVLGKPESPAQGQASNTLQTHAVALSLSLSRSELTKTWSKAVF